MSVVQIVLYILGPWLFLRYSHLKVINTLSPVVCCYILGVVLGNIPIELNPVISKNFAELSVPLAIPLLLLSTDFIKWTRLARTTVISFFLILFSVMLVSFSCSFLFQDSIADHWKIAGMLVGVYTGGTPNMTAIGKSLDVSNEVFILMNGADLIIGGIYLLFILSIGHRLIGKFLIPFVKGEPDSGCFNETYEGSDFQRLSFFEKAKRSSLFIIISVLFLGVTALLAKLTIGKLHPAFIILGITTLGLAFSFVKKLRETTGSYEVGEFLLLIFCVAVGSMANIQNLAQSSLDYLGFAALVMLGSISLHILLCKLFKVDKDTAVITSIAGVFGPPFVVPMAQALGNKEIIISGLTSGLIGYALRNYLGIGLAYFVQFAS